MQHICKDLELYSQWLAVNPSADTYVLRARTHALLAEHKSAAEDLEKAIELSPNHADAHHHMAIIMIHSGDYKKANEFAKRAHELNPDIDDLAWMVATEAYRLTKKIRKTPTAALYHKRGLLVLMQGAYHPAKADLEKAIALDPELESAYTWLATAYMKLNEPLEAERVLDEISDKDPAYSSQLILKVKRWVHLERKAKHTPCDHTYQELQKILLAEDTIHTRTRAEQVAAAAKAHGPG